MGIKVFATMMKADAEKRVGWVGVRMVSYSHSEHISIGADQTSRPMLGAVLGLVQQGAWSDADPVATAERAVTSLLGLHANCMSSSRRLLILADMMAAANR